MAKVFISYSHKNEAALDRLHTHLATLRREGLITEWYDREIPAGKNIDRAVETNLKDSDIFIALVSADFLNSSYCYDKEMTTALERHEVGTINVIPIIVGACDWRATPLGKLKALPKDGKPISTWTNEDVAYLDVVMELRRALDTPALPKLQIQEDIISKNQPKRYRIKTEFDAIDRADFSRAAFTAIRDYFQRSIAELNQIGDPIRARFENMSEGAFTCTVLNKSKRSGGEAHITFHLLGERSLGDIIYSFSFRAADNTSNGQIRVQADEYQQYLVLNNFSINARSEKERLSSEQVAERVWREFISQAGVDHD